MIGISELQKNREDTTTPSLPSPVKRESLSSRAAGWIFDHHPLLFSRYFSWRRRLADRLIDQAERARDAGTEIIGGEGYIRQGDRLRDAGRYAEAAEAYGNALGLAPTRTDIRIQHGNMLKDCGRL